MIIYLVLDTNEDVFYAAFSTKEKAIEYLAIHDPNGGNLFLEEYTLDQGFQK